MLHSQKLSLTSGREPMMIYLILILCVFGIASGQILFKLSADSLHTSGSIFDPNTAITLFFALAVYGLTTIAWVWALQKIELGRAYPLMALAFILVPIGSHLILGERFNPQYFIGTALIIAGILTIVRA
jgi:drug/metabolite transporter (DMT)-like permease